MIRNLRGKILEKHPDRVVVEAGGVGYGVAIPIPTAEALGPVGSEAILFVHHRIREDAHDLFGFSAREARDLFERMLRVKGFAARSALSILSHLSPEEFRRAVATQDLEVLVHIPGIGKKTAEKILLELRDAFAEDTAAGRGPEGEVLLALEGLGYRPIEARRALDAARKAHPAAARSTQDLLREALKTLRRGA